MDYKEAFKAIRELLGVKLEADPAPADPAQAAADVPNTAKLKDGTEIKWSGELAEGTEIKAISATGEVSPPDGTIEMEDGTMLTISGGKVTAIVKAIAPEQGMNEGFEKAIQTLTENFTAQIDSLKSELAANKTAYTEQLHNINAAFVKTVELVEAMNTQEPETEKPVNAAFAKQKEKEDKFLKMAETIKNAYKK